MVNTTKYTRTSISKFSFCHHITLQFSLPSLAIMHCICYSVSAFTMRGWEHNCVHMCTWLIFLKQESPLSCHPLSFQALELVLETPVIKRQTIYENLIRCASIVHFTLLFFFSSSAMEAVISAIALSASVICSFSSSTPNFISSSSVDDCCRVCCAEWNGKNKFAGL